MRMSILYTIYGKKYPSHFYQLNSTSRTKISRRYLLRKRPIKLFFFLRTGAEPVLPCCLSADAASPIDSLTKVLFIEIPSLGKFDLSTLGSPAVTAVVN